MVAINIKAPMTALLGVLQSAPLTAAGLQTSSTGMPESFLSQVSAFVAMASWRLIDLTPGVATVESRYRILFGYMVAGAEATAEEVLADVLTAFILAMLAERRTRLGGTVDSVGLELGAGGEPQYVRIAGQENRLVEIDVVTTQASTF